MKKKYISALISVTVTVGLLTLTSCGNNDTPVSAVNDVPAETETTSTIETTAETGEEKETSVTVDLANASIPFEEGGERGGDTSATVPAETVETVETVNTLPFSIDDFDFNNTGDSLITSVEAKKAYIQFTIEDYEAGEIEYIDVLQALAEVGIDNSEYLDAYLKEKYKDTNTSTPEVVYPEGYDKEAAGLLPEQEVEWTGEVGLHPELKDVQVY